MGFLSWAFGGSGKVPPITDYGFLHFCCTTGKITLVHTTTRKAWQIQLPEIDYDDKAPRG